MIDLRTKIFGFKLTSRYAICSECTKLHSKLLSVAKSVLDWGESNKNGVVGCITIDADGLKV